MPLGRVPAHYRASGQPGELFQYVHRSRLTRSQHEAQNRHYRVRQGRHRPANGPLARALETAADGKTVIDVTNALSPDFQLAVGFTTSGAEKLQKVLPRAHVVKAFNTVFAQHMSTGKVNGEQLTAFAAGDNEAARKAVLELAKAIGVSVRNWFRSMPVVLKLPPIGAA